MRAFRLGTFCVPVFCALLASCASSERNQDAKDDNAFRNALMAKVCMPIAAAENAANETERLSRLYLAANKKWPTSFNELLAWTSKASVETKLDKSSFKEIDFSQIGSALEIKGETSNGFSFRKKFGPNPSPFDAQKTVLPLGFPQK